MKKFVKKFQWFTLVEIMIVIAIIGILAAVLYPSVTGYFERARDTAKKQNIRQLELAINMYHSDMGTYKVPNVGYDGSWWGFVNFTGTHDDGRVSYAIPMDKKLRELGYTTLTLKTLQSKDIYKGISREEARNRTECYERPVHKDMYSFNFDDSQDIYVFTTFLEKPTQKEKEYIKTVYYAMGEDGTCSRWWMNYAVSNR